MTTIYFSILLIISTMILILNFLISFKTKKIENKSSPFECGFNPMTQNNRTPFSIRFFTITLIFLIFDIEIAFIIPMPTMNSISMSSSFSLSMILIIILFGLFHEWWNMKIDWMK